MLRLSLLRILCPCKAAGSSRCVSRELQRVPFSSTACAFETSQFVWSAQFSGRTGPLCIGVTILLLVLPPGRFPFPPQVTVVLQGQPGSPNPSENCWGCGGVSTARSSRTRETCAPWWDSGPWRGVRRLEGDKDPTLNADSVPELHPALGWEKPSLDVPVSSKAGTLSSGCLEGAGLFLVV